MATKTKSKSATPAKVEIDWTATFIEAVNAPGSLGNTYNRFYSYSFLNQIRLLMQGVQEPVATYRRWTELGFQVQKGSKAKTVLAPLIITKRDETGKPKINAKTGKPEQVLIGFRESNTVFAFSDTDGEQLPEIELPAWDVKMALASLNIKRTRFRNSNGNIQGYSSEENGSREVAINPAAKYPAKTMLHEIAHIVLGHCKALAEATDGSYEMHRGIGEFEAESVAYLVAKELELATWDPSESRAYIMHYLNGEGHDPVTGESEISTDDKHISRIFSAANKILVAGREKQDTTN